MRGCGGCEGLGAHSRLCPEHPQYHPYLRYERMAEDIGDGIGGTDPALANAAYALAGRLRDFMREHPYRRPVKRGSDKGA